jgi:tellurite resistance protein TehA-like permease
MTTTDEGSAARGPEPGPPPPDLLRLLHPGWFAAVMGTAIVAVATYDNPGGVDGLEPVAHAVGAVIAVLAYVLMAVLLVAYLARWVRHRDATYADLRHPVLGAMYGTVPGGLVVVAVMTTVVGPSLFPSGAVLVIVATLTAVGGVLAFVVAVAFSFQQFAGEATPEAVNGGWFIPPVVTIIVPIGIAWLVPHAGTGSAGTLLAVGYALFGMGFLLFRFVMSMLTWRLVLHPLPGPPLAPSLWIGLGPVGAGTLWLLALSRGGAGAGYVERHRRRREPAGGHGAVGTRPVVARGGERAAGAVRADDRGAVRSRLVGVHVPARRLHRRDPDPGAAVGLVVAGVVRRGALPGTGRVLGHRHRPHGGCRADGRGVGPLTARR